MVRARPAAPARATPARPVRYAEPADRKMRVELAGALVAQSDRVTLLHETGRYPGAYFPAGRPRRGPAAALEQANTAPAPRRDHLVVPVDRRPALQRHRLEPSPAVASRPADSRAGGVRAGRHGRLLRRGRAGRQVTTAIFKHPVDGPRFAGRVNGREGGGFDCIAHVDLKSGKRTTYQFAAGDAPGDPVFVPRSADAPEATDGSSHWSIAAPRTAAILLSSTRRRFKPGRSGPPNCRGGFRSASTGTGGRHKACRPNGAGFISGRS